MRLAILNDTIGMIYSDYTRFRHIRQRWWKKLIWILFLETEGKGWIGDKIKYGKCQK